MRIVHLCVSCFYIDGYAYQENELVAQNVADGHDVVVIASTETYGSDRRITYLEPCEYLGTDGAKVIRLPYRKILPHFVMRKLRMHPGIYQILENVAPDVILFHGLSGWELNAVSKYKRLHPDTRLYVDSHEDFNNSARSFISKYILHHWYYRSIVHRCLMDIEKILCISVETMNFARDFYGLPQRKLEFFPLGGRTFGDSEYEEKRLATRKRYDILPVEIVFIQTGKIDRTKKLLESLSAFSKIDSLRFRFIIVGHISDDIAEEVRALVSNDDRIRYLGWKSPDDLSDLLCAADIYVQPGTQSATMQMSLCCRCGVILDDVPSHEPYMNNNGWLVGKNLSLDGAFRLAADSAVRLPLMSRNSADVATRLLDYKMLADRLYR